MVYCNLISVDENTIKYAFGGVYTDLTGELVVNRNDYTFNITKSPSSSSVLKNHIDRLLRIHRSEFLKGDFKKSIAYEIG